MTWPTLVQVVNKLRSPEGCPWDREQDHDSLKKYLIEESYEVIESIEEPDIMITDNKIMYGENSIEYTSPCCDFIEMDTICNIKLFEIPENKLYKLIKNTSYCIAQDERRPIFTGLNFQKNKVCALDEFRLAICSTDKFYTDDSITLPGNLIKLLLKVLNKRSENTVQAYTDNESKYVKIVIGDLIITSKLLPGEFIRYSSIIPKPIAPLRIGFGDQRARHYGISHHSLTVLAEIVQSRVSVPLPVLSDARNIVIYGQLTASGIAEKHHLVEVHAAETLDLMESRQLNATTMGRGLREEPEFFMSAGAAGILAAQEVKEWS